MPPELLDLLKTLLGHPVVLGAWVLVGAWLGGFLAKAQLTHAGLDHLKLPGVERLDWATLGGAAVFWLVAGIGAGLLVPETALISLVLPVFGLLIKACEVGLVLGVAAWVVQSLSDPEAPDAARERRVRTGSVGLAGFVAVALITGSGWIPLLLLAATLALVIWLARDPAARTGLMSWVQDIAAGLRLRGGWGEGGEVHVDGRTLVLTGPVGLGETPYAEAGAAGRLRNRELAALVARAAGTGATE